MGTIATVPKHTGPADSAPRRAGGLADHAQGIRSLGHTAHGFGRDGELTVHDVSDPTAPTLHETRPGRPRVIQSCDVFVDADGVMYVTDHNAGLHVRPYQGP